MVRPRSAQRRRISAADDGDATKSGSKISTPSNPAAAAAASLSSNVPDRQTVATAVRGRCARPGAALVGSADTDIPVSPLDAAGTISLLTRLPGRYLCAGCSRPVGPVAPVGSPPALAARPDQH